MSLEGSSAGRKTSRGRIARLLLVVVGLCLVCLGLSCTSLGYYGQSIWGQISLLAKRRAIEAVIADPGTPPQLVEKLRSILAIREFASTELGLPDGSYRTYVHLERPHVVWNVVAAPDLSVLPLQWCFPVAGCVSYRGYFAQSRADRFARRMSDRGNDVSVAGVSAYSTLGWFKDPVLSTFIDYPETRLAGLLFHELTHQVAYAKGDTEFNESLATTVEILGVARWLASGRGVTADAEEIDRVLAHEAARRSRQAEFIELVTGSRDRLEALYQSDQSPGEKRLRKVEIFAELEADYRAIRDGAWNGYRGYDDWFDRDLNNAHLASIGAYYDLVPAFEALLDEVDGDLSAFFVEVQRLASSSYGDRRAELSLPASVLVPDSQLR